MKNHNGDIMRIDIKKYRFNDLYNKLYDSDWLEAELLIKKDLEVVKITLDFLVVEELERINNWLIKLTDYKYNKTMLDFIDSNMIMKLFTRSNIKVIKMLYYTNDNSIESWELIANNRNLNRLAYEIRKLIIAYPCRCGFTHENLN
jgi:hypothetical protein